MALGRCEWRKSRSGAGDFDVKSANAIYANTTPAQLPNAVCLLDKGLIVYTQFDKFSPIDGTYENLSLLSHPARPAVEKDRRFAWTLYSNGENETRALSWGVLYGMLVEHLMSNTVKPESPIRYLQKLATTPIHTFLSEPDARE